MKSVDRHKALYNYSDRYPNEFASPVTMCREEQACSRGDDQVPINAGCRPY